MGDQLALFDAAPDWPEGFRYAGDMLTPDTERQLLAPIEQLPFREFEVLVTEYSAGAAIGSGPARTEWEHSIPPVDALRYSITFRNLRASTRA